MAVDSSDNVYVTGWYTDDMTIGTTDHTSGDFDMFLAKFDSAGNYQWSHHHPGARAGAITVGPNDKLYVTGDADHEFFGYNENPGGPRDLLVAQYDASGRTIWGTTPESSSQAEIGHDIAVDASGNVYVTGGHDAGFTMKSNGVSLPHSDSDPDYLTKSDLFVMKLDSSGNALWGHAAGGPGPDQGTEVAVDPTGGSVIGGFYQGGQKTLGGKPIDNKGSEPDMILASFQSSGPAEWIKNFGDTDDDSKTRGVDVDASGNVYMSGYFEEANDFGGGTTQNAGGTDIIVASYDASGSHRWSKHHGTRDWEKGADLVLHGPQTLYMSGEIGGSIDFGDGRLDPTTDNEKIFLLTMAR